MIEAVLVDTDVFSYIWQGRPEGARFVPHIEGRIAAICFTSVAEAYFGAYKRRWGSRKVQELEAGMARYLVLPYDRQIAQRWAELKVALESEGKVLGVNDLWIAATALRHRIPLATNNRQHFERVPDLHLVP